MSQRGNGRIINIASIAGKGGRPVFAAYAASKAAVINLTQSFAIGLAPFGITVNAVCPGIVPTAMWANLDEALSDLEGLERGAATCETSGGDTAWKRRVAVGRGRGCCFSCL